MRFHALVFAHTLGLPLLPIAYEDKRTDFIAQHGYPLVRIEGLTGARLICHLAAMLGESVSEARLSSQHSDELVPLVADAAIAA